MHFVIGNLRTAYTLGALGCTCIAAGNFRYQPFKFTVIVCIYFYKGTIA